VVNYQAGALKIKRRGYAVFDGLQLGSGFDLDIKYARDVSYSGSIFGVNDQYDLTDDLAKFLSLNHQAIQVRLPQVIRKLAEYRRHYAKEFQHKAGVLSYAFLIRVYNWPCGPSDLVKDVLKYENDLRVRQLLAGSDKVFEITYERLLAVSHTEVAAWWYIFWVMIWSQTIHLVSPDLCGDTGRSMEAQSRRDSSVAAAQYRLRSPLPNIGSLHTTSACGSGDFPYSAWSAQREARVYPLGTFKQDLYPALRHCLPWLTQGAFAPLGGVSLIDRYTREKYFISGETCLKSTSQKLISRHKQTRQLWAPATAQTTTTK
jgi:hypothetical protein